MVSSSHTIRPKLRWSASRVLSIVRARAVRLAIRHAVQRAAWSAPLKMLLATGSLVAISACRDPVRHTTLLEQAAIERTIKNEIVGTYDFSKPDVVQRFMALYAPNTRIISASGGRVVTTRDSLQAGIQAFWNNVGRNMQHPKVEWTSMYIDVLSPQSAVMTATYRIAHQQPNGLPHVIGGAWTAAFQEIGGRWLIVQEHLSDDPYAH